MNYMGKSVRYLSQRTQVVGKERERDKTLGLLAKST